MFLWRSDWPFWLLFNVLVRCIVSGRRWRRRYRFFLRRRKLNGSFICECLSFWFRLIYRLNQLLLSWNWWRWRIVQILFYRGNWFLWLIFSCILIGWKPTDLFLTSPLCYGWRWRCIFHIFLFFWRENRFFWLRIRLLSFNCLLLHFTRLHCRKRDNFVVNTGFVFLKFLCSAYKVV